MEAIKFVNDLKHTLWSIDTSGGNPAVYVTPDHDLLEGDQKTGFVVS